jgi:hypothetical protein
MITTVGRLIAWISGTGYSIIAVNQGVVLTLIVNAGFNPVAIETIITIRIASTLVRPALSSPHRPHIEAVSLAVAARTTSAEIH